MTAKPITIQDLAARKGDGPPIVMITAHDFTSAQIASDAGVEILLVGDSLAMTVQGLDTTLPVTLEEMIYHSRLVRRGSKSALVVTDMPFMSYHVSPEQAVANAGRCVKEAGAHMVKLEGGERMAETLAAVVRAQIPVMGHIGLTPQSINALGGFKVQRAEEQLIADAKAVESAGASMLVIEAVPPELGKKATEEVSIPTIGIGAGPDCDGQVLVFNDAIGMFDGFKPKFVKRYAELGKLARDAVSQYAEEVKSGTFPAEEHTYK